MIFFSTIFFDVDAQLFYKKCNSGFFSAWKQWDVTMTGQHDIFYITAHSLLYFTSCLSVQPFSNNQSF